MYTAPDTEVLWLFTQCVLYNGVVQLSVPVMKKYGV